MAKSSRDIIRLLAADRWDEVGQTRQPQAFQTSNEAGQSYCALSKARSAGEDSEEHSETIGRRPLIVIANSQQRYTSYTHNGGTIKTRQK
jgi:hypothetical protein